MGGGGGVKGGGGTRQPGQVDLYPLNSPIKIKLVNSLTTNNSELFDKALVHVSPLVTIHHLKNVFTNTRN